MRTRKRRWPSLLAAGTVRESPVRDCLGKELGRLEELMLDLDRNRIAYAVLSLTGRPAQEDTLFAVPWEVLRSDVENGGFMLDVPRERLEKMEGFARDDWPEFSDHRWAEAIHLFWLREYYETGSAR